MPHWYRLLLAGLVLLLPWSSLAGPPVVLFDQGHGQRFILEQQGDLHLSGLGEVFQRSGFEVRSTAAPLTDESLGDVRVLVTSGLFVPYSSQELQAILHFVERGGGLSVMLHIAPTYGNLLSALGVLASPGVLNEGENLIAEGTLNFRVTRFAGHPLTEGLPHFSLYGGWAVMAAERNADSKTVAFTSSTSWIDADRNRQRGPGEPLHSYGVLVAGERGRGRFAVFGDDAIFQNRFLDSENRKLAVNLVSWLREGGSI